MPDLLSKPEEQKGSAVDGAKQEQDSFGDGSGVSQRIIDQIDDYNQDEGLEEVDYSKSELGRQTLDEQRQQELAGDLPVVNPLGKDGKLFAYAPGQGVELKKNRGNEVGGPTPEGENPDGKEKAENPYNKRFSKEQDGQNQRQKQYILSLAKKDPAEALRYIKLHPVEAKSLSPADIKQISLEAAKGVAKDKAKDEAKRRAAQWASRAILSNPYVLAALGIGLVILILFALVIGIAVGLSNNRPGDGAPIAFGIGGGGFEVSEGNPEGIRLVQMAPGKTLDILGKKIAIDATSGRYGVEGPVILPPEFVPELGYKYGGSNPGYLGLTPNKILDPATGIRRDWTPDELKYYITMRWQYKTWAWNGTSSGKPKTGFADQPYYAGRRLIVFNPKTKKAVVVVAAESGPAPFTGVCNTFSPTSPLNVTNKKVAQLGKSCAQFMDDWNKANSASTKEANSTPVDYYGRIMGFPGIVAAELGVPGASATSEGGTDNNESMIVGWAADQNLKPGPLNISDSDIVSGSLFGSSQQPKRITAAIQGLPVQPIAEGEAKDCGEASMNMVLTYYITNRGRTLANHRDLPEVMRNELTPVTGKDWLIETKDDGEFLSYCTNNYVSKTATAIRATNPTGAQDISDLARVKGIDSVEELDGVMKNALREGHPIILFTKPGSIYPSSKHIYVVTGFDSTKKSYIVNNPFEKGIDVASTSPNGKLQTSEHILEHITSNGYLSQLIVNKKFCQNIRTLTCEPGGI